jgi:hypothetical protein
MIEDNVGDLEVKPVSYLELEATSTGGRRLSSLLLLLLLLLFPRLLVR